MGFSLGKMFKSVGKTVKKVFKGVGKVLKKIWDNKIGKTLVIGGALVAGAWAMGAFAPGGLLGTAATNGVAGTGLGAGASSSVAGSTMAADLTAAGIAPAGNSVALGTLGTTGTGEIATAISGGTAFGSTAATGAATGATGGILGSLNGAGEALVNGAKSVGGFMADNPALTTVAGMGLSGAVQAKAQQDALTDERNYQNDLRNKSTAYGLSYDGTIDRQPVGSAALGNLNQQYAQDRQPQQATNILGGAQQYATNQPAVQQPRARKRFNPQTNQWEAA